MVSPITIIILVFFGILFVVVVLGFVLATRESNERPKRYKTGRRNDVSPGYIPYRETAELEHRRRESMIVIGIIILFIVISILASVLF